MNQSLLELNLKSLEAIYPGQAKAIRATIGDSKEPTSTLDEMEDCVRREFETRWNPQIELHVVDRFSTGSLARLLFDRVQMENLRCEIGRRIIFIEDRLENLRDSFEKEDWRSTIESEICLFVISPHSNDDLQRLLMRYPDIASAKAVVYRGDFSIPEERYEFVTGLFARYCEAIQQRVQDQIDSVNTSALRTTRSHLMHPNSIRFFIPGHNYLQDACVRSLRRMGYGAERLQWKNPLYRFARSTAWTLELQQNPFDLALFLNATPKTFGGQSILSNFPLRNVVWFVDNPRRYTFEESDFEGCDIVGVFDRTYIPFIQERCSERTKILEVRTGYGVDPKEAQQNDSFSNLDIAFVGELGTRSFLPLEKGFLRCDPSVVETVNASIKELDITQPIHFTPVVEGRFQTIGWDYRGALVEYLENKAAGLRRRYYLDALADRGLVVFGDEEWKNDPSAGPLRACYGGKRIAYGAELASLYASVKININVFHVQCVYAPNPRVYDVLACGGFLLTSDAPGLADEFEDGKDLVVFRSKDDLVEKVDYYLAHPEKREEIAMHGQKRALASCAYHDKMQKLLYALSNPSGEGYVDLC